MQETLRVCQLKKVLSIMKAQIVKDVMRIFQIIEVKNKRLFAFPAGLLRREGLFKGSPGRMGGGGSRCSNISRWTMSCGDDARFYYHRLPPFLSIKMEEHFFVQNKKAQLPCKWQRLFIWTLAPIAHKKEIPPNDWIDLST